MEKNNILYQLKTFEKLIIRMICNENKKMFDKGKTRPSATQHQILEYIVEHQQEDIYQKDLEKVLNLRRATVSGVLQTMEKNELIERVTDLKDTRTKKIILNKKSKKIFEKGKKKMLEIEKIATSNISKEELKIFSNVLQKMKQNIEKESKM